MGDAGLVLTAASTLVFRAWTQLAAALGEQKRLEIAGKEGSQAGALMWGCCTFCQLQPWTCTPGPVLGCALQLSQGAQFPASGEKHLPLCWRLRLSH